MERRSYSNHDKETRHSRKEETQDNIVTFSPQVHFQTISSEKAAKS